MTLSTARVILVRHGRSTFNDQGRYQGSSNAAVLTPKGLETAQLVGAHLNQRFSAQALGGPIDLIYTSPLRRVQQTAGAISQAISPAGRPPIVVSHDLKEISLSLWEGLTYAQVKQQYPQHYQTWQQHPEAFELPVPAAQATVQTAAAQAAIQSAVLGREATAALKTSDRRTKTAPRTYFPVQALYQSAQRFWQTVLPQSSGKTLLIVSHSGTIHALISTALGLSSIHHHSLQQSNCGISELTFSSTADHKEDRSNFGYAVQLHQLNQTSVLGETLPKIKTNKRGLRLLLLSSDDLHVDECALLAERMKRLPLDFCVATEIAPSRLRSLFQHCSDVPCLEAQTGEFLQRWRQQLVGTPRSAQPLTTGLAIAPTANIQTLLMQTLGHRVNWLTPNFSAAERACIRLRRCQLSIIHYPHQHRPVVQAINTFSGATS